MTADKSKPDRQKETKKRERGETQTVTTTQQPTIVNQLTLLHNLIFKQSQPHLNQETPVTYHPKIRANEH